MAILYYLLAHVARFGGGPTGAIYPFPVLTTVWFFIGGLADMKKMFAILKTAERDTHDDGTVRPETSIPAKAPAREKSFTEEVC